MILRALWLCMRVLLYKCYSSFFYTRSLGNGNSKFRLWKQLKNLQKKTANHFHQEKKMFNNFDHFYFGKKGTVTCILQNIFCIWPFLIWYAKHEIPMQNFWGLLANFFSSKVTKSSTGQLQWSPNFGVIYPVTRPTGCLLSQFWRNFCPKAIQSKSVDVALHLWAAKKMFGKPLIMN